MKKIKNQPILKILLVLAIIAAILTYLQLPKGSITLTKSEPANQQKNVLLTNNITFTFSKTLAENQGINVVLTPNTPGKVTYSHDRTQASFTPDFLLKPNTTYVVTISSTQIKTTAFSFTTINVPSAGFTSLITPPGPGQTVSPDQAKYNLINNLPHQEDTFYLQYNIAADMFIATVLQGPSDQTHEKIYNYIKGFGISDPGHQLTLMINIPRDIEQKEQKNTTQTSP